jgi:hypothetical protein
MKCVTDGQTQPATQNISAIVPSMISSMHDCNYQVKEKNIRSTEGKNKNAASGRWKHLLKIKEKLLKWAVPEGRALGKRS